MKRIMRYVLLLAFAMLTLHAKGDLYLFEIDNTKGAYTPEVIEKAFAANGYYISANSEMNKPFTVQFGQSDFTIFTLLTVFNTKLSEALVRKHPKAGIFVPMGVGIYQAKDEKTLHVSILTAEAWAKILGFDDPLIHQIEAKNLEVLKKALPGAAMHLSKEAMKPEGALVTTFELEVDPEEWSDTKDEVAMLIEEGFKPKGFVMSNYTEYNYMLTKEDTVESPFDFYDTYSICKLKVIYNVAKTRPEAAAFAPCTFMFYKQKGSDKFVMGFPGVYNWMSSANVTDKTAHAELMKAQSDFENILKAATE